MIKSGNFKDIAVLLSWVLGLLLFISLLWILTQPLQTHYLLRTVNNVFISSNDSRRITEYLPLKAGRAGLLGYWYSMHNSTDRMFVFGAFQDGILVPLGAIVSADGNVREIIPLSAHAAQVFDTLQKSIIQIYINRIETAAVSLFENMEGGRL